MAQTRKKTLKIAGAVKLAKFFKIDRLGAGIELDIMISSESYR